MARDGRNGRKRGRKREAERRDSAPDGQPLEGSGLRTLGIGAFWLAAFVAAALLLAWPAVDGEFLSDDHFYIVNNYYLHELSLENFLAILDPYGEPAIYTLNYAPLHLYAHALEWALWEDATRGYHVVNAVLHGLTSALLIPLFRRAGLPPLAALLGAVLFLVHPANVETVAWIFQLKTILSLALGIGALLLLDRRPALAMLLFAAAILTKITAIFALPVALAAAWGRQVRGEGTPRWGWLAGWAALLLAVAVPEMIAFERADDARILLHEELSVHVRTIIAIAMRYLVMAFTGHGVATFQEPPPALSWLDPWWLCGLLFLGLLLWRMVVTLWRGDAEATFWIFAAGAYAPVSQVFPFMFPMGDRYLYTVLPGLFGGAMLAVASAWPALQRLVRERLPDQEPLLEAMPRVAVALAVLVAFFFAARSHERAAVFVDGRTMMVDSALRFPNGMQAALLRAHTAADRGDAVASARSFEIAIELGFSDLTALLEHPGLESVRGHPEFQRVMRGLARRDIERLSRHEWLSQGELLILHVALMVDGDREAAVRALRTGLEQGGPLDRHLRSRLRSMGELPRRTAPQP
ncbi:MAG: hypothetical protein ACQGVK_21225 [Myxococcota bacterium]